MRARLSSLGLAAAVIAASSTSFRARAAEPIPAPTATDYVAFPYVRPVEKHHFRAAMEITTIYGVGLVDYMLNTSARGGHLLPGDKAWDFHYDWPTFKTKLTGENYHLDTNRFNTNYVSHPFAGTLYYWSARSNHLSIAESSGYAIVGAFIWEYFGEFREEVSINDVIVTPGAGIAIGETTMQLGGFFRRGRKSVANDVLATLIAPARTLNDWFDGAEPLRSEDVDDLGFARDEWHRFDLSAGGGVAWQRSEAPGHPMRAYGGERVGMDLRVVNLPGYGSDARRSDLFDDGNAAELRFDASLVGGKLADAAFATEFMPVGYYWRDARLDAAGRAHGDGALVGLRAAFEYEVHDYFLDHTTSRGLDVLALVSPVGLTGEYTRDVGRLHLRARFDMSGSLAGVESAALTDYRRARSGDDTDLQTVLRQQGYYHALGVTVSPLLSLAYGAFEVGGRLRLDSFRGIEGYDEQQDQIVHEIPLADRRMAIGGWTSVRIPSTRMVLRASARHLLRTGDVGEARTSRSETSMFATLGVEL